MIEPATILERGWIFRVIPAVARPPRLALVFIHGWTGDEHSMEIFSRGLPDDAVALFPRGPIPAPGGYGWATALPEGWPGLEAFEATTHALLAELDLRLRDLGATGATLRLAGFSQGASMCHALTLLFPQRIERAAILSGFLPYPANRQPPPGLSGKQFYVAHGTQDETIPIHVAEQSVAWLRQAGALVHLCQSNTGHKLALDCLKGLQEFLYA